MPTLRLHLKFKCQLSATFIGYWPLSTYQWLLLTVIKVNFNYRYLICKLHASIIIQSTDFRVDPLIYLVSLSLFVAEYHVILVSHTKLLSSIFLNGNIQYFLRLCFFYKYILEHHSSNSMMSVVCNKIRNTS